MIDPIAEYFSRDDVRRGIHRAAFSPTPEGRRLEAIVSAYMRVRNDPNMKLPTVLMCAIEAARA